MPTYRRPLNTYQLEILQLLYRFRFATTEHVAYYQNKPLASSVFNRLRVLCDQEYIGRHYSKQQQSMRQPAIYYLLPKGIAELRKDPDNDTKVLHAMYKDQTASQQFINHSLSIFDIFIQLEKHCGDRFDLLTKSELSGLPDLPPKLPDAEITLQASARRNKRYILLLIRDDVPPFAALKRVQELIDFEQQEGWQGPNPPGVLIVCDTAKRQKLLRPRIGHMVDGSGTEQHFYITNRTALTNLAANDAIWQNVVDPIELVSLSDA